MIKRNKNTYQSLSDNDLVRLYKANPSMDIIGELYKRYGHLVFGTIMKYVKNISNTEDISMILFEQLGTKIQKSEIKNFKPWLYTVTKNEAFQFLRKKGRLTAELSSELQSFDEIHLVIEKEYQLNALEHEIDQLNEEQRKCIILFYIEQKSYQEIASILPLDLKKVKSAIQNGKRNLKIKLENNEAFK